MTAFTLNPRSSNREIVEGRQFQGIDEAVIYSIDTAVWGGSPSNLTVGVKKLSDGSDATSTVMNPNSPSVSTDTITLSSLDSLTEGEVYRVEVQFDIGSDTFECFFYVYAEL
jgi:hypothetical protein